MEGNAKMTKERVGIFVVRFIIPAIGITFACIYFTFGMYMQYKQDMD